MHHELEFLHDLAIVMVVAGLTTLLFHKLKQPVVLGYILAGFIIGPHTPPWPLVTNQQNVKTLAELGVIFLMFRMGLHFSLRKLFKVGPTALIAALFEIVAMIWIGYEMGLFFGWSKMDSLFLGAILSISSTTIIAKALSDLKLADQPFAELIYGILIVEDILGVALLTLLSSVAINGSLDAVGVAAIALKLSIFLVGVLVGGLIIVPRLLRFVWRFRDTEMLLVAVLGICFGVALLAAQLGYSVALGAFLVGAIMAETREAGMIEKVIVPLRDMFSAIFFVAVGMLINPQLLADYAMPIAVITVGVIIGKIITCSSGAFIAGNNVHTSLKVGMGLAQIGEFSFIIAQLGVSLGVTSEFIYPIAVSVSALTTVTTPYLIQSSDGLLAKVAPRAPQTLVTFSKFYTSRVNSIMAAGAKRPEQRILIRSGVQLLLNLLLVAGLLVAALPGSKLIESYLSQPPKWIGGARGLGWFVAMFVSLPLIFSSVRKIGQIADLLTRRAPANSTSVMTNTFRSILYFIGCGLLMIWVFVVSAALIPEGPVLLTLIGILFVVAMLGRQRFIRVYASGKHNFLSALSSEFTHERDEGARFVEVLKGVEVETVEIVAKAPVVGKLIRELHLRSTTGATIVAIDRLGVRISNPGPDEEVRVGDTVVLLGSDAQVRSARIRLSENG